MEEGATGEPWGGRHPGSDRHREDVRAVNLHSNHRWKNDERVLIKTVIIQCKGFADDNAAYRKSVDTQGNITEEPVKGIQGVKEMMETGDTDSDMTTSEDRTEGRLRVGTV